jgi:hypothetical protein
MHSRKRIRQVSLVAVLVLVPFGCQEPPAENPESRDPIGQAPKLRTGWKAGGQFIIQRISFGGKPPIGPFEVTDSVWQDDKHWLLLCVAEYPGKPKGPVALVIARVPRGSEPATHNVSDVHNIFTIETERDLKHAGPALLVWALRKDISESMQIGGKEYDLTQGRVFLVDAVSQPVSAHQISAELGGTFDGPGPDLEKLGAELESLLEKDVKVKRFWMGDHPDAEDS